jgi:O-methyltransferase involved in polyketide biosynthesis
LKCKLLEKEFGGRKSNYFAVPGDLRNMNIVHESLITAGMDPTKKTFILSEMVLAYLSQESSSKVLKWVSETFERNLFVEFETINPFSAFGNVMIKHFIKLG